MRQKLLLFLCFLTSTAWAQLSDLTACDSGVGYGIFDLDSQTSVLIGGQGGNHLVTFHTSLADATVPTNPIMDSHAYYGTDGQVIYARDQNVTANTHTIASFSLRISVPLPQLQDGYICQNIFGAYTTAYQLNSGLPQGQYSFAWKRNGEFLPDAYQNTYLAWLPGTYTVLATRGDNCTGSATCVINPSMMVYSGAANVNGSTVTLIATPVGDFIYSIDEDSNGNYQESNVFENITPGIHIGYIKDLTGCSELAFVFDTTLSIRKNQFTDFSYGPNPVNDKLNISNGQLMDSITVYNALGQIVFVQKIDRKQTVLDCTNFQSGIYSLTVVSDGEQQTFRIIKK